MTLYLLQIIVNGEEYHTFEHRISVDRVRALNITGDVDIRSINFIAVRLLNLLRHKSQSGFLFTYLHKVTQYFNVMMSNYKICLSQWTLVWFYSFVWSFQGGMEQFPDYEVCFFVNFSIFQEIVQPKTCIFFFFTCLSKWVMCFYLFWLFQDDYPGFDLPVSKLSDTVAVLDVVAMIWCFLLNLIVGPGRDASFQPCK